MQSVALGTVIRGGTAHFEYVAGEASSGLGQVAMQAEIPVAFGVLTTETLNKLSSVQVLKQVIKVQKQH